MLKYGKLFFKEPPASSYNATSIIIFRAAAAMEANREAW